jgi:3-oxoacyl-[acyl-carrier protein] reductase
MGSESPVALVTGSNRGSGRAIAGRLHERGYRVFSLNRTVTGEDWLGERECDLASRESLAAGVAAVLERAGRLDVVIANAVERVLDPIEKMSEQDWDRQLEINLSSVFRLVKQVLPALRRSRGLFLVMGSHAGSRYFEGGSAYSATKAALKALVETLLLEERNNGVRACLLAPGAISNLDGDDAPTKVSVESVGTCVASIVADWPADLVVGELEFRPALLPDSPVTGIDRLLHV